MTIPTYAELRCVSNFTFLRGGSQPEDLVERAKQLGYTALATADECSIEGIVRAHVAAKEHDLKLLGQPGCAELLPFYRSHGFGVIETTPERIFMERPPWVAARRG